MASLLATGTAGQLGPQRVPRLGGDRTAQRGNDEAPQALEVVCRLEHPLPAGLRLTHPASGVETAENGAPVGSEHHAGRLDPPVNDSDRVQVSQRGREGGNDRSHLFSSEGQTVGQRRPVSTADSQLGPAVAVFNQLHELDHSGMPGALQDCRLVTQAGDRLCADSPFSDQASPGGRRREERHGR